jgi:hypothetical protein
MPLDRVFQSDSPLMPAHWNPESAADTSRKPVDQKFRLMLLGGSGQHVAKWL